MMGNIETSITGKEKASLKLYTISSKQEKPVLVASVCNTGEDNQGIIAAAFIGGGFFFRLAVNSILLRNFAAFQD